MQAYADFKPQNKPFGPVGDKVLECDAFWDIKGYDTKDLLPEDYVCGNPFGEKDG